MMRRIIAVWALLCAVIVSGVAPAPASSAQRALLLLQGGALLPTYLADFTTASLPSGVTVSSPSLGGLVTDASGKLTYKPNNLGTFSERLVGNWATSNVTLNAAGISAPFGVADTAANTPGSNSFFKKQVNFAGSGNFIQSFYAKSITGTNGVVAPEIVINGSFYYPTFDTLTGTATGAGPITVGMAAVPGFAGWYRCWAIYTSTGSGVIAGNYYLGAAGSIPTAMTVAFGGAQYEAVTYQTTPGPYVATQASAYYGPAWDYDPVSVGTPLGLRVWESRTNLFQQSNAFTTSPWTTLSATVASAQGTAPDGTNSAWKVTYASGGYVNQSLALSAAAYTFSVYVKYVDTQWVFVDTYLNSLDRIVWFDIVNGVVGGSSGSATGTITPAGNGWYKITATITAAPGSANNTLPISATGNNSTTRSGSVLVYGAQYEVGATAGPYIPDSASAVTAAADIATFTIPSGVTTLRYTFDDNSTQDIAVSPGAYTIPFTTLNRHRIKKIRSWPN